MARGAWADARTCFVEALRRQQSAEALEGLGMATWWLEEYPAAIESREHAFRAYRQRNEQAGAARMAVWLANDYADFRGELAVANGWLRRAERILGGTPLDPEHAWLAYTKAHFALMVHRDPVEAWRSKDSPWSPKDGCPTAWAGWMRPPPRSPRASSATR